MIIVVLLLLGQQTELKQELFFLEMANIIAQMFVVYCNYASSIKRNQIYHF